MVEGLCMSNLLPGVIRQILIGIQGHDCWARPARKQPRINRLWIRREKRQMSIIFIKTKYEPVGFPSTKAYQPAQGVKLFRLNRKLPFVEISTYA